MNDMIKVLIGVLIGLVLVAAAITFAPSDAYDNTTVANDGSIFEQAQQTFSVNNDTAVDNTQNATNTVSANTGNGTATQASTGSGVSGGGAEFNGQEGSGYIYQINYTDGNFRQYDTKTGELIGSTFPEDQAKLGYGSEL